MNPANPHANANADAAARFDLLLTEVLQEVANPDPTAHFDSRLHHALQAERGLAMTPTAAATYPISSVLWSGQQPAAGWNLRGFFGAALGHGLAILLIALLIAHRMTVTAPSIPEQLTVLTVPPLAAPRIHTLGGGGGQAGPTPVTKGNPPKFATEQLNPPKAPPLEQPKINVPVTVIVQPDLKMAHSDLPKIGMPGFPLVGMSMGNGHGTGLGSGNGAGIGQGSGGNTGGGIDHVGGGVSAPIVLFQPEPEFSEEARKAKVAGNVLVYLQVDPAGHPQHVRVLRGIGLGLDEKAVAAVQQYRFKPAMKNGQPVTVEMHVEVNFQIF